MDETVKKPNESCSGRQTLLSLLRERDDFVRAETKWDRWNYQVFSPASLDDNAQLVVELVNRDSSRQRVTVELSLGWVSVTKHKRVRR